MIAFIKGTVDSLSEGKMILESHGIGYELNIPASMFDAGVREGEELKIYTHMSVREDGISLFGFLSREDLEIYRMLIGVSGIGPKAALAVLSTLTADNLRFAVLSEDVQAIAKTPGIGKKTAQKLILELKDKLKLEDALENAANAVQNTADTSAGMANEMTGEAVQALVALGYGNTEALKAGRRTGCLPGCGTGADCAWLLRNGSTAGSKESRNHRRHGQRGCAESGIEAYVLADGPKLWKKETL